ncbi:uncharacterized protein [Ptychodera flava]|uniref:uncharacterized protein n=1 Tax=Ptychodera flava TaxID=63121 RepID=UPI00396A1D84
MVIAALLIGMGQNIMVLHLKQIAIQKGAGERDLQMSPIYYGSATIFGLLCYVIFPPRCKEREEDNIINLWKFGVSLVAAGVAVIGSVQSNSFGAFIGINIISAAGSGFYLPLMFVLLKAFCKEQDDGNQGQTRTEIEALRFVLPAFGIGALIGLPIGDVLNTNFGDGSSYYLAGVTLISACPLVLVRGNLKWCKRGRELAQDNHEP